MTLTPQERTELQRLAEQATPGPWWQESAPNIYVYGMLRGGRPNGEGIVTAGYYGRSFPDSEKDAAFIAAANPAAILDLLSLAAQSEKLRAELEKERAEHLDHEDRAQREIQAAESRYAWEVAAHKVTAEELRRKATLESRYSALVTVLKQVAALEDGYVEDSKEAAQVLTIIGNIVQDAFNAPLDSEASQ